MDKFGGQIWAFFIKWSLEAQICPPLPKFVRGQIWALVDKFGDLTLYFVCTAPKTEARAHPREDAANGSNTYPEAWAAITTKKAQQQKATTFSARYVRGDRHPRRRSSFGFGRHVFHVASNSLSAQPSPTCLRATPGPEDPNAHQTLRNGRSR